MKTNDKVLSEHASINLGNTIQILWLEMLYCHKKGLKMSRFLDVKKYACVKDLTNIMSELMFVEAA